ncbi:hypothetical protein BsWGS_02448 [Bradybaena similaris]
MVAYHTGCHDRVMGSIHSKMEFDSQVVLGSQVDPAQNGYQEKRTGKVKAAGVTLIILPTEYELVYTKTDANTISPDMHNGMKRDIYFYPSTILSRRVLF